MRPCLKQTKKNKNKTHKKTGTAKAKSLSHNECYVFLEQESGQCGWSGVRNGQRGICGVGGWILIFKCYQKEGTARHW
jgi:hypothetical protein